MILNDLAEYLEDQGIGTVGTDIFIGQLPLTEDDCLAIIYAPSPVPNKAIPYFEQTVDVWVRFTTYDSGYDKMLSIFNLIHRKENWELDNFHIYLSFAMGMIDDYDKDAQDRYLFKCSFGFLFREDQSDMS